MDQPYLFGDDAPKKNPWTEDRFGYLPLAKRLSDVITQLDVPNGYVIGLSGEWGSGKSTAVNFVKTIVEKYNEEHPAENSIEIIDFRPWIVSGHQDVTLTFFQILLEALNPRKEEWRSTTKRLSKGAKSIADPVVDAVTTILSVHPIFGVPAKFIGAVGKKSLSGIIDRILEEPSFQTAYEKLRLALEKSQRRFLIVIDDIDRLEKDEIKSIMQMVKTVGQLPHVIYLLSYDRQIVWEAIGANLEQGRSYAEKMVQQEIDLPSPPPGALRAALDKEIAFLPQTDADSIRWYTLVLQGLDCWIRKPRDVVKLANSIKFSWPPLKDEIDPKDLIIVEGLRLFEPIAFDWIKQNRDFLFSSGRYFMADDEIRNKTIDAFKEKLSDSSRDRTMRVLGALFPAKGKLFGQTYSNESISETVARRGLGCEAGYDAYFRLHPSSNAIPKTVVDSTVQALSNENQLVATFETFLSKTDFGGNSLIGELLQEIQYRFESKPKIEPTQELLNALFRIGDSVFVLKSTKSLFFGSPHLKIRSLIHNILRNWSEDEAAQHLDHAFKSFGSVAFKAKIFVDRAGELRQIGHDASSPSVISLEGLKLIGQTFLKDIRESAENGSLRKAPFYWDILQAWKYLTGPEEVKHWVSKEIEDSPIFLARLARGWVLYNSDAAERPTAMGNLPDPTIYDYSIIQRVGTLSLNSDRLTDDQKHTLSLVVNALDRHSRQMHVT